MRGGRRGKSKDGREERGWLKIVTHGKKQAIRIDFANCRAYLLCRKVATSSLT